MTEESTATLKKCSACQRLFERAGFHKNRAMSDGLSNLCKQCEKASHTKHRKSDGYKWTVVNSTVLKEERDVYTAEAKRRGISLAEFVRQSLNEAMETQHGRSTEVYPKCHE